MLDSDYSSSEEEDNLVQKLENLNLDELEPGDLASLGDESLLEAENLEALSQEDSDTPGLEDLEAMLE